MTAEELVQLAPYLELAREIHHDVARVAADDSASAEALVAAVERIPNAERDRVVRAVFERLPADQQWAVLERAFGDAELRLHLEREHAARLALARRLASLGGVVEQARAERCLDLRALAVGTPVSVGLFGRADVADAVGRGHTASTCARQLDLRCEGDGWFRVLEDVFNPGGAGYFVTADYDERAFAAEHLASHTKVRLGAADGDDLAAFEPCLFPGARLDVATKESVSIGRLHTGFVTVAGIDVFAAS